MSDESDPLYGSDMGPVMSGFWPYVTEILGFTGGRAWCQSLADYVDYSEDLLRGVATMTRHLEYDRKVELPGVSRETQHLWPSGRLPRGEHVEGHRTIHPPTR